MTKVRLEAAGVHLVHYDASFRSVDEAVQDGAVGNIVVIAIRYVVSESPMKEKLTVPDFDLFSGYGVTLSCIKRRKEKKNNNC